jgi:outer membrane lipoprotein-sorting protein
MKTARSLHALTVLLLLLPLGGCLVASHKVERRTITTGLKQATRDDLVQRINAEASKIQTLDAVVDISATTGGEKKGKVTEYTDIRGYMLVREPQHLRLIGLFPVVRNKAFDMVSDGTSFKLYLPTKNRFIVGRNDVPQPTTASLENLRPQVIFDALLLHVIDPKDEIAILESGLEEVVDPKSRKTLNQPDYMVTVIRRATEGGWYLSRKIIFSRTDLQPHRQLVYDKAGNIATDAKYEQFTQFGNMNFPALITILRPQEEYSITLKVVSLKINTPLKDEQFALAQPPGTQLVNLDQQAAQRVTDAGKKTSSDGSPPR